MQNFIFVSNFFIGFLLTVGAAAGVQNLADAANANKEISFEKVLFLSEDELAVEMVCSADIESVFDQDTHQAQWHRESYESVECEHVDQNANEVPQYEPASYVYEQNVATVEI